MLRFYNQDDYMPEYVLILLLLFLVTLFLHRQYKIKIFKSRVHLFIFYAIFLFVGTIWDQIAISRGQWFFGEEFLLGPRIGLIPIEDYGFALVLPYFGLVVYKIVGKHLK